MAESTRSVPPSNTCGCCDGMIIRDEHGEPLPGTLRSLPCGHLNHSHCVVFFQAESAFNLTERGGYACHECNVTLTGIEATFQVRVNPSFPGCLPACACVLAVRVRARVYARAHIRVELRAMRVRACMHARASVWSYVL